LSTISHSTIKISTTTNGGQFDWVFCDSPDPYPNPPENIVVGIAAFALKPPLIEGNKI